MYPIFLKFIYINIYKLLYIQFQGFTIIVFIFNKNYLTEKCTAKISYLDITLPLIFFIERTFKYIIFLT